MIRFFLLSHLLSLERARGKVSSFSFKERKKFIHSIVSSLSSLTLRRKARTPRTYVSKYSRHSIAFTSPLRERNQIVLHKTRSNQIKQTAESLAILRIHRVDQCAHVVVTPRPLAGCELFERGDRAMHFLINRDQTGRKKGNEATN